MVLFLVTAPRAICFPGEFARRFVDLATTDIGSSLGPVSMLSDAVVTLADMPALAYELGAVGICERDKMMVENLAVILAVADLPAPCPGAVTVKSSISQLITSIL